MICGRRVVFALHMESRGIEKKCKLVFLKMTTKVNDGLQRLPSTLAGFNMSIDFVRDFACQTG